MQFVYGKRISTSCLICTNIGSRVRIFLGPSRSTLAFFQQFMARSNLLYKLKKIHVTKHCRETDSVQRHPPPPTRPEKPHIPGLYNLREIGRRMTLPWTWDCKSGDDFVRKWNDSLMWESIFSRNIEIWKYGSVFRIYHASIRKI